MSRALVLLALLAGCASAPAPESEADGPVEAVVRQVMTESVYGNAVEIPVCFEQRDFAVSANVVRRLAAGDKRVRRCVAKALNVIGRVWVDVRSISKPATGTYVVHAGHWCGVLCADDVEYTVEKRGGAWVVTRSEFQWIS